MCTGKLYWSGKAVHNYTIETSILVLILYHKGSNKMGFWSIIKAKNGELGKI